MGIVVSKENYAELNEKASKRFDPKTAESIVRNLCRALATDERWVKLSPAQMQELAKEHNFELAEGDFEWCEPVLGVVIKRENGFGQRYYSSKDKVVKGWHSATCAGLIKDGIKAEKAVAGFVFEIGQKIIKTNNVNFKPKSIA